MNDNEDNWRALADALVHAKQSERASCLEWDFHWPQDTARACVAWLDRHGYRIVGPHDLTRS